MYLLRGQNEMGKKSIRSNGQLTGSLRKSYLPANISISRIADNLPTEQVEIFKAVRLATVVATEDNPVGDSALSAFSYSLVGCLPGDRSKTPKKEVADKKKKMSASWRVSRVFARNFSSSAPLPGQHHGDAGKIASMWKKIFFFVGIPAVLLGHLNVYLKSQEPEERPPFVPMEYLRIRTKRYPWGDGTRTAFHNPHVNALPTGYEDEHH